MTLGGPWINRYPQDRRVWEVRWTVAIDGRVRSRSRAGFARKAVAQVFGDNLVKASLETDGWRFENGHPVNGTVVPSQAAAAIGTVVALIGAYVFAHLPECKPKQRTKIASVLARVIAETLTTAGHRDGVRDALARTNATRRALADPDGAARAGAAVPTFYDRVAVAVRDAVLVGDDTQDARWAEELAWLEAHSLDLDALDERIWNRVQRTLVEGTDYSTARTYWAVVKAWCHWLVVAGRVPADPLAGFADIPRHPRAEQIDPAGVPDRAEWHAIADRFAEYYGAAEALFVLVVGYAALRLGEGLDLRAGDFFRRDGRWWLRVMFQHSPTITRHETTNRRGRQPTKEQRDPIPVAVPLPRHLNPLLDPFVEAAQRAHGSEPAFRGPRGGRLIADTFRESHWHRVTSELFPAGHRLHGIVPHAGRHFGMTNWLRAGVDYVRCAQWGRWDSIKIMLDTYAGVLPSDDAAALARLDGGRYGTGAPSDAEALALVDDGSRRVPDVAAALDAERAGVVDLMRYRRRRTPTNPSAAGRDGSA